MRTRATVLTPISLMVRRKCACSSLLSSLKPGSNETETQEGRSAKSKSGSGGRSISRGVDQQGKTALGFILRTPLEGSRRNLARGDAAKVVETHPQLPFRRTQLLVEIISQLFLKRFELGVFENDAPLRRLKSLGHFGVVGKRNPALRVLRDNCLAWRQLGSGTVWCTRGAFPPCRESL